MWVNNVVSFRVCNRQGPRAVAGVLGAPTQQHGGPVEAGLPEHNVVIPRVHRLLRFGEHRTRDGNDPSIFI